MVVLVGVNADVWALGSTPLEGRAEDPLTSAIRSDAVDSAIGQNIVEPCTIFNQMIGRIVAEDEDKSAAYMSLVLNYIAHVALDVVQEL